ncbi:uncharacterized protein LOC133526137 [Cydia pomonella]|uniref:uncharacterized protein LOC133526137 n=1 Tax=Cydia pomonella TaxID=82600 RepID=UPI002ADD5E08|nr:uncharacterized protein LOC133526137 [Cydia pomonella]
MKIMKNILFWAILVNGLSIPSTMVEPLEISRSRPGSGHRLEIRRSRPGSGPGMEIRRNRLDSGHGMEIRRNRLGPEHRLEIRRSRLGSRHRSRREYDSDFESFMKKMFSDIPQPMYKNKPVREQKRGANLGYRPYWYGYNFANDRLNPKQTINQDSSHEEWDYGMGRGSGQGIWGGGSKALLGGADDILGAGSLVDRDISGEDSGTKGNCYANLGPRCRLGPEPTEYDEHTLEKLIEKTKQCEICSAKHRRIGLVCTMDTTGTVFQEMELCVMEKMNCLRGVGAVKSSGKKSDFGELPFALKPGWGRISVRGEEDAYIRFYDTWPYKPAHSYWIILNGRWGRLRTRMWQDERNPPLEIDNPTAVNAYSWKEYTVVWNPNTGWFLMSQPREPDWESHFYIYYTSPFPWDIKYVDVSGNRGYAIRWILHDLVMINEGRCLPPKPRDDFPTDTEEVLNKTRTVEKTYHERVRKASVTPEDWSAEDGPYIEYPHGFFEKKG